MKYFKSVLEVIGNTPLIELKVGVGSAKMARVLMKAEYLQPSGSLKDRMALAIIEAAEKDGSLKPGGVVVEATAGNTGIALSMVAAIKGYKSIFVMPDKFSIEKINLLKAFGSQVVTTPTQVPDDHPDSWKEVAKKIASETPNSILANQFYNRVNVLAHYQNTGPEIWEQTGGEVDCFISGAGSGGTISGVGKYLKEKAKSKGKDVKIVLMDPDGSSYADIYYKRKPQAKKGWKLEGIGNDFIPGCLDFEVIDEVRTVTDRKAFFYARRLAREQGLFVGDTSGAGVSVALDIARELGPGKTVVCVLCDSGNRYVSKIYNDDWMKANGFGTLGVELCNVSLLEILNYKGKTVYFAEDHQTLGDVVEMMSKYGISQLPFSSLGAIKNSKDKKHLIIHESDVLHAILSGEKKKSDLAIEISKPISGILSEDDDISLAESYLDDNRVVFVQDKDGKICGVLTRIDVVRYLTRG